jgi:hypothetical protein
MQPFDCGHAARYDAGYWGMIRAFFGRTAYSNILRIRFLNSRSYAFQFKSQAGIGVD